MQQPGCLREKVLAAVVGAAVGDRGHDREGRALEHLLAGVADAHGRRPVAAGESGGPGYLGVVFDVAGGAAAPARCQRAEAVKGLGTRRLATVAYSAAIIGVLHGLNVLAIFATALLAGHRVSKTAPLPEPSASEDAPV